MADKRLNVGAMKIKMKKLIGKHFGKLKIVEYYVKQNGKHYLIAICKCGTKRKVSYHNLHYGQKSFKSCNCLQIKDITGMQFGRWTILKYAGTANNKERNHLWLAKCCCGTVREVSHANLVKGLTASCGCKMKEFTRNNMIDLSGKKFGKWLVLEFVESRNGIPHWKCRCECETERVVSGKRLKIGRSKSCGCSRIKHGLWNTPEYYKYKMSDPFKKLRLRVSVAVSKALKRNGGSKNGNSMLMYLSFTIKELREHLENLWEPWMNWENYGGRSDDKRKTWHIDHRIPQQKFHYKSMSDSSFFECWSLPNLRPLEKKANMSKGAQLNG